MGHFVESGESLSLTPSIFGKLLVLAWAEKNGRSNLPSNDDLSSLLLANEEEIPALVLDVMHVEDTGRGRTIAEITEYVLSAQRSGLMQRANPSYKSGSIQIGSFDAGKLLKTYETQFYEVIGWLRSRISGYPNYG